MKRCLFSLSTLFLLLFMLCACKNEPQYSPKFDVGEGFSLNGNTITGTVIGEEYFDLFAVFDTREDFVIFGDATAEMYLELGIVPLKAGENRLVVRFMKDDLTREYDIKIEYVPVRSFSVEILNPDKTYHIGEAFDKSSIRVLAITEKGETVEVDRYNIEYEFSDLGEHDVGIELGNMYESITVQVTDEYLPTLDGNFSADGVIYSIENDHAVLMLAEKANGFFAIPRAVLENGTEYPVTEIANGAFSYTELVSILIPETVAIIGEGAFSGCAYLETVTFPETMQKIGRQAFSACESLTSLTLPEGLTELSYGTFLDCPQLFRVTFPSTLTVIGEKTFSGCKELKTVKFPTDLRLHEIGASAFADCMSLTTMIPGNIELLADGAFSGCKELSVFASAEVGTIGKGVFENTKVTLYTTENSSLFTYAKANGHAVVSVETDTPYIIHLPQTYAIEDGYPYGELLALMMEDGRLRPLKNYEIQIPTDACGYLDATLVWQDFSYTYTVFVSYTETVALDSDTRGVYYELEPATKTAILISCPTYVKRSKIYRPTNESLFIVPTAISRPDGIYTVIDVRENAFEGCENITSVFVPNISKAE